MSSGKTPSGPKEDELKQIEKAIANSSEERDSKIDWTKAWSKKYPVLARYREEVDSDKYAREIRGCSILWKRTTATVILTPCWF